MSVERPLIDSGPLSLAPRFCPPVLSSPLMPFHDLQAFVAHLEATHQLKRVKVEVDPVLEAGEIAQRVLREGGPAILFERPRGGSMPLVMNLFGTMERIRAALGREPAEIGEELVQAVQRLNPPSLPRFGKIAVSCPGFGTCVPSMVGFRGLSGDFGNAGSLPLSHSQVLAPGWRPLHHVRHGHHAQPAHRRAEPGPLSPAGLQREPDRHALAKHEGRPRTLLGGRAARGGSRGCCRDRSGSDSDDVFHSSVAGGHR